MATILLLFYLALFMSYITEAWFFQALESIQNISIQSIQDKN